MKQDNDGKAAFIEPLSEETQMAGSQSAGEAERMMSHSEAEQPRGDNEAERTEGSSEDIHAGKYSEAERTEGYSEETHAMKVSDAERMRNERAMKREAEIRKYDKLVEKPRAARIRRHGLAGVG